MSIPRPVAALLVALLAVDLCGVGTSTLGVNAAAAGEKERLLNELDVSLQHFHKFPDEIFEFSNPIFGIFTDFPVMKFRNTFLVNFQKSGYVISAKNHKHQSVTAKREKSQTPKV